VRPSLSSSGLLTPAAVVGLQQGVGNQVVLRWLAGRSASPLSSTPRLVQRVLVELPTRQGLPDMVNVDDDEEFRRTLMLLKADEVKALLEGIPDSTPEAKKRAAEHLRMLQRFEIKQASEDNQQELVALLGNWAQQSEGVLDEFLEAHQAELESSSEEDARYGTDVKLRELFMTKKFLEQRSSMINSLLHGGMKQGGLYAYVIRQCLKLGRTYVGSDPLSWANVIIKEKMGFKGGATFWVSEKPTETVMEEGGLPAF
jgi:hypothetical protein